ncbi:MAG: carboxypeptidase regulatory-like domain-containing protein, partial [Acidobacteriales bacterium]|nr:carboxypeptidase regulatory-like domain-containing protein [Terriglobales bacterium]
MKNRILVVLAFALIMITGATTAFAQVNVTVKGKAVDADGKPIVGAKVEMVNKDNGRKFTMKTGKDGSFMNIGVSPGTYSATLTDQSGKIISKADNFNADPGKEENRLDFNIQAEQKETQAIVSGEKKVEPNKMTEEQRKALEAAQKQQAEVKAYNEKVGGLNQMLTEARADNKSGNFQGAIQLMTQA